MSLVETNRALRAALNAAEQKLAALSDSYPIGVYHCDAGGARTYTNLCWQQIFGLFGEASLGHAWLDALHPADLDAVRVAWKDSIESGREFDMEFRIVTPSGVVRTVRSRARPVVPNSAEGGFVGALEDVTERRENEDRLRASEAFLERTGRIAGVGGWEVELGTGVVTWSAKTRAIHDLGPEFEPTIEDGIAFYALEARPIIQAAIDAATRDGKSWDLELPFVSATGRELWVRTIGEAEYRDGKPIRISGAFQDVTEHHANRWALRQEQSLRLDSERHAQELDKLLKERGEMLDVMAHEVRQPLNNASAALQSAAAALRDVGENNASKRVSRAQVVMAQVLASIDNTLAVASLLARPDPIECVDTDIDAMLQVAIGDLPSPERSRVAIERVTQTRTASMDMSLIRLALRNLLSNALKYSSAGADVVLRVSDSDDPLALILDVTNAGGAIPDALLPALFSRGARSEHHGVPAGHGLGLYIVRRVMDLHRGSVQLARNEPGAVCFRLCLNQSPE